MNIYRFFNRSYRGYVPEGEPLQLLNVIILSAAVGQFLFAVSGGPAFTSYASTLGAGEFAFGMISALPIFASILQLFVSYLMEKTGKSKEMFMIGGIIQRVSWIVVAFIPCIFPVAQSRLWMLITLVTLAAMGGSFVAVTHMSLMAVVIPMNIKGRYITARQRVCTAFSLVAGLSIAYVLDNVPGLLGYTVVFAVGGFAGLADILMYSKFKFPAAARGADNFSFKKILKECLTTPKTRDYMLFWICWNFACNLVGPFFGRYAMDVMVLPFTGIIIFGQATTSVITLFVVSQWGMFIDRYGSKPLLTFMAVISTLNVFVWITAVPGNVWPWFLFNFLGGICWCGIDACTVNMQFSHTPENGRPVAIAVYAVVTSAALGTALIIGGALLEYLSPIMQKLNMTILGTPFDNYKLLFCISILLRIVVISILLPKVLNDKGISLNEAFKDIFLNVRSRVRHMLAHLRLPERKQK